MFRFCWEYISMSQPEFLKVITNENIAYPTLECKLRHSWILLHDNYHSSFAKEVRWNRCKVRYAVTGLDFWPSTMEPSPQGSLEDHLLHSLTREVSSHLNSPISRRMKAVVIPRREVDGTVVQRAILLPLFPLRPFAAFVRVCWTRLVV